MEEFIAGMEKGELHVHLNGLVSTGLLRELLSNDNAQIPDDFDLDTDLARLNPCTTLLEYLKPWQVMRMVPRSRESLGRIVANAFENLKLENVSFVELRNSVIYIASLNNVSVSCALRWLISEIELASERFGIKAGLILTIPRGMNAPDHLQELIKSYVELGRPQTVIGLDLAGNEDIGSPREMGGMFAAAKSEHGLMVTVHAGETGSIENVWTAVNEFKADRIGHGTAACKSPETMSLLRERNICVEVCTISNRLTGAVKEGESHPVVEFIAAGVPFVICSDNPGVHLLGLTQDYLEFYRETGNSDLLASMFESQKEFSFIKGLR